MEETNAMRTLVIDRETWGRGDPYTSLLLNNAGKMCCLGFYAKQLAGAEDEDIRIIGVPSGVARLPWGSQLLVNALLTPLCVDLIKANDDVCLSDATRELSIATLFAKMNVAVQFVGGESA